MRQAALALFDDIASKPLVPTAAPPPPLDDEHRCAVCGALAGFGFGVFLRRGIAGRWSCFAHRATVEATGAGGGSR